MNLKDRAVLVKFTDRCWVGGTIDRPASEQVEDANNAKHGTGHYWKRLVPKAAIKERVNIGADARGFHDNHTLPWLGGGVRILPAANFSEYMAGMRRRQTAAELAVKKFIAEYDQWVEEAKRTQGKLFDPADYPTKEQLKSKFGFEIDVIPLPNMRDWRVDISQEQADEVRRQAEARFADVQTEGITTLLKRLEDSIKHVHDRLSDPKNTFRDTLVSNLKGMVDLVGRLNYTGDHRIDDLCRQTAATFADLTPQTLRSDPAARAKAANDASSILSKMASFMGAPKIADLPPAKSPPPKKMTKDEAVARAQSDSDAIQSTETAKERKNRLARERRASKKKD